MIEQDTPKKIAEALVNHSEVHVANIIILASPTDPFPDFHYCMLKFGNEPGDGAI